ncbi:MAG: QueT transporter family protein [Ruthenibacterium lactatiformans]
MKKTKTRTIVRCALIASLYTAVSLVLAPIAFGAVQARVSEAFTLLPVLVPDAVVGVTLGCFLTNLVGVFTGANVLGALDIVFGTAATLTAALCTRRLARVRLRGLPVAAAVPPVLINAVVVGAELAWAFGPRTFAGFLLQAGGVALGQLFSCFALGLPLVRIIEKNARAAGVVPGLNFFPLVPRQELILSARMAEPTARGCFAFLPTKE